MKKVYKLILSLIITTSCGVKGGPYPPFTDAPETVKKAYIKQQDGEIVVYWNYIPRYADGRKMNEKYRFEVYSLEHRIIKDIKQSGNLYWFRFPFSQEKEYCFRFKVVTKKSRSSFSKYFCYIPTFNYPKTKPQFEIFIVKEGIKLKWDSNTMKTNIYKSLKREYYPIPVKVLKDNYYVDKQVREGVRYCYYVTYENKNGVESFPSDIKCRIYKDIFPPEPPKNPKIIKKDNKTYLVWTESSSKDVIGYIIEINGKPINKVPIKTYILQIPDYKKGIEVKIYAVDKSGNRSSPAILK
ncbi:hypothetical protein SAMN06265182_1116 [Persephonella hydrogeniphila]|uniref:Fibronectin type-III domain-containing protein n=1 Tax=Persephonella hydrogeniphila TaxID=198703 RepID=A0A285NET9_9AQUI|nr:hypothetical protein [Persephonella hydrogeniphila]SNZ07970.1 hypothetical protein SAMN06265182_1116 [Persephonella hydrogeniphila]